MTMLARQRPVRFGVIGLGVGSVAAFAGPNSPMTFFEIDPEMETIARRYFTFLERCGRNCNVVIGDGRLELSRMPNGHFNLLMLDAFSSDAIPTHLLSREAVQLYLEKLTPDGIILFHVSNRYLDVTRLVATLVKDVPLVGYIRRDVKPVVDDSKLSSIYIAAARRVGDLGSLTSMREWEPITPPASFPVWTDDYSNLLSIVKLR